MRTAGFLATGLAAVRVAGFFATTFLATGLAAVRVAGFLAAGLAAARVAGLAAAAVRAAGFLAAGLRTAGFFAAERDAGFFAAADRVEPFLPYFLMKASTSSRASSSRCWTGGDFIRYADGHSSGPEMPLSSASLIRRTASITMPAELGESHTSSLTSAVRGTSPKARPSRRMYAHLRSVSHGT